MTHQPDIEKIPKSLRSLDWTKPDRKAADWHDGDRCLAAVPLIGSDGNWEYEFFVIAIRCDDECFATAIKGERDFGLDDIDFDDIDFLVKI
jgi:hypothetical protein